MEVERFIHGGDKPSTRRAYQPHWKLWEEFHMQRLRGSTDVVLREYSEQDRADLWVMFIRWLTSPPHNKRHEQVFATLRAVRKQLIIFRVNISFLGDEGIREARKASGRSNAEQRTYLNEKRKRQKLPAFREMLDDLREHLWTNQLWDRKGALKRAIYLAFLVGCNEGPRPSNCCLPERSSGTDHACRAEDFVFTVAADTQVSAGSVRCVQLITENAVVSARITYVTTKTGTTVISTEEKVIARRSPEEEQLLDDLTEWVMHAALVKGDLFFTIKAGNGKPKRLQQSDMRKELKESCVRLNVPPEHFSLSSARRFYATQTDLAGISAAERNQGQWAAGSRVPDNHYSRASTLRGSLATLSMPGVQRLSRCDIMQLIPYVDCDLSDMEDDGEAEEE